MKIKGSIVLESTGQALQKDDKVCSNDNVIFKTADAVALVHSASKGRFTLRSNKSRLSELEGVIMLTVSSALSKTKKTLDTKSLDSEVRDEFDVVYCVIGKYDIPLIDAANTESEDNYFILRFKHNNDDHEIKLKSEENVISLDRETILKPLLKEYSYIILPDVALYYHSSNNPDEPKLIDAFDLLFPDEKSLAEDLSNFKVLLKTSGRSDEQIQDDLIVYMYNAYGAVNKDSFLKWLNFNVK